MSPFWSSHLRNIPCPEIAIPRWSPSRHKLLCRRNQRKLKILLLDRQFKWDFRRRQNRVPRVRFYPLVHVADILYSVGETLDAINAYKMASDAAISVSDPMERIFALDDVATARFEAGDVAGALSTLSQLYEVARIFPDSEWSSDVLAHIAGAQVAANDIVGALSTAESIPEIRQFAETLSSIGVTLARQGK